MPIFFFIHAMHAPDFFTYTHTTMFVIFVCSFVSTQQDTGSPAGFMSDCPGMNRTTRFSEETKRTLSVVLIKPAQSFFDKLFDGEKRCRLSIRGAAHTARYLDLKRKKIQVVISGYLDASFSPVVRSLISPYLDRGQNVIVLEIFPILVRNYPIAARVTKPLGELLGEYLAELTRLGLSPNRLELLGGSLGAHIASYASVRYRQLTGRRPARLTGLDPAGPCFRNLPRTLRFHAEAAERVDALHTNIDGLGIAEPLAQIDFYANGGEYQPSMARDFILPCFLLCSHVRSVTYWVLAFKYPEKFIGIHCDSVANARRGDCYNGLTDINLLGPKTNFNHTGIYYLPISDVDPYYMAEEGLKPRGYGINNYILSKSVPDVDIIV